METAILIRSFQCKSFKKYSRFYVYIVYVLVTSTSLYVVSIATPSLYPRFYWFVLFITLSLGYSVIIEICRHVFAQHVSLARLARWIAVTTYGTILLLVVAHAFFLPRWSLAANTADLERYSRIVEAVVLMTVIFLAAYYGIEMGKNMRGMILGFGVYVGVSVLTLALRLFVGIQFSPAWKIIHSSSYLAALSIGAVALWFYEPVTSSRSSTDDVVGYQMLAGRTQGKLGSINEHLNRTAPR